MCSLGHSQSSKLSACDLSTKHGSAHQRRSFEFMSHQVQQENSKVLNDNEV